MFKCESTNQAWRKLHGRQLFIGLMASSTPGKGLVLIIVTVWWWWVEVQCAQILIHIFRIKENVANRF